MTNDPLNHDGLRILRSASDSGIKEVNIRLREGEYQFELAKAIASFQLELHLPDVKDLIGKLYGEAKKDDIQFIRMIQTILKKMERSDIVKILPKKKPWELQSYALSSFKFRDVEKNLIVLATEVEVKQALRETSLPSSARQELAKTTDHANAKVMLFMVASVVSYAAVLWTLMESSTNPLFFVLAFSAAAAFSVLLGLSISQKGRS